jgi:hypothetical protein
MNEQELNEYLELQKEYIKKYGYYTHSVVEDGTDELIECHTHGILRSFGNLDLQIVATPLINTPDKAKSIIERISVNGKYENIKDGTVIGLNIDYKLYYATAKLIRDEEWRRVIYRIIVADENGLYPWNDGCNPLYKNQFTDEDALNNRELLEL